MKESFNKAEELDSLPTDSISFPEIYLAKSAYLSAKYKLEKDPNHKLLYRQPNTSSLWSHRRK